MNLFLHPDILDILLIHAFGTWLRALGLVAYNHIMV